MDRINESYQPLKIVYDYTRPLYFLSDKNMDGKTIRPRIPKTYVQGYEDGRTTRICCSPSIGGCMRAIDTFGSPSRIMYLHVIEDTERLSSEGYLVKPTPDRVFDVDRTDEYWLMCPAKLKCKGKVQIGYRSWYDHSENHRGEYDKPHVKFHYIEKYHQNENIHNTMDKKELYENIMRSVAVEVKKALNENKWENADHKHVQESQLKPLQAALMGLGYHCTLYSKDVRQSLGYNFEMSLRYGEEKSYVKLVRKKAVTSTGQLMLQIGKYNIGDDDEFKWVDDDKVNKICIIIPPLMNYDPNGKVVDNTKACFFDKETILNAYVNGELKDKLTRNGKFIVIPERWAKTHAEDVISYKNR